ncbi:hypothetical protein [Actinotalea fermentans]|uniref:hypothetical protein n=1 Tax=Actinotalea fermentans TaxID=43671 RepID=UPI00051F1EB0|nr:hypothetical protein [Actinotalea fermentans]KGM17700.1 hypothetical protein N867_15255 [Actinotalea fermentans ATCC 43279 = JCM 9966 = DSM 3133]
MGYATTTDGPDVVGEAEVTRVGAVVRVVDVWALASDGVTLTRRLTVQPHGPASGAVHVGLDLELPGVRPRYFAPGMAYAPGQWARGGCFTYADHRLAYPVVAAHVGERGAVLSLERQSLATYDAAPERRPGQTVYRQRTDVGSVGFRAGDRAALCAAWPYAEVDESAMLDAQRSPAVALHPVGDGLDVVVRYRLRLLPAADYVSAVRGVFGAVVAAVAPEPSPLPVSLEESIALRLDSAAKTYTRFADGFAGFVLNVDPDRGYASQAKAFGASFADHHMDGSREILEFGFTGRQLNIAAMLARRSPRQWRDRAAAVVDGFVERMTTPSGWVHTLWDAGRGRPLFACGDPSGTVMHYLGRSDAPGTYTRMMCEAGSDLLLNVDLRARDDVVRGRWWAAAVRLAEFLVRVQEPDGAWYRAYAPDGSPLTGDWLGDAGSGGKSATGTVVPFLLDVAARADDGARYIAAARRAAGYILAEQTASDEYRGGTLDNPNVVDKEAAFIAMRALLAVHRHDPDPALLEGARRAAVLAVTWHSIWEVPAVPGTRLATERVRSVGWGGINPVWGVGVTDIYSLFFLADLHELAGLVGDQLFAEVARLSAHSSLQILAVPHDRHGLADAGMQPEGISFCPQGVDDGLIAKGDTWGGLAWPYTAGTFALERYLEACARDRKSPEHDRARPTEVWQ